MKKEFQQIIGYLVGAVLVLLLIPLGLYRAARQFDPILDLEIFRLDLARIVLANILFVVGSIFGIWSIVVQNTIGKGGPVQIGSLDISPKRSIWLCQGHTNTQEILCFLVPA